MCSVRAEDTPASKDKDRCWALYLAPKALKIAVACYTVSTLLCGLGLSGADTDLLIDMLLGWFQI